LLPILAIINGTNIPDFMILTKHSKILHIYNGEDSDTSKKGENNNAINSPMNTIESINPLNNNASKKNESSIQYDKKNKSNSRDIETSNDSNTIKNTPNYDIDKYITISKVKKKMKKKKKKLKKKKK